MAERRKGPKIETNSRGEMEIQVDLKRAGKQNRGVIGVKNNVVG